MNHYTYDELTVGQKESFKTTVTEEKMNQFLCLTGDTNPLHTDDEYAAKAGFEKRVVYGMLTASYLSTLAGVYLPGEYCLLHTVEIGFAKPVRIGDELEIVGEITDKNDLFKTAEVKVQIFNQDGVKVSRGKIRLGLQK